jgi:large subunit ribosomal protein L25
MREVMVEALPADLPDALEVDISELEIGHSITVADLVVPEDVEITDDPETTVCSVTHADCRARRGGAEAEEAAEPALVGEEAPEEEASEEA